MRSSNPMSALRPMTEDFSIEQPDTAPSDADEKRKKSISRSKQWKEFVAFARQRQELYRRQTPGGVLYRNMPKEDAGFYAMIGDCVMEEIDGLINYIEGGGSG